MVMGGTFTFFPIEEARTKRSHIIWHKRSQFIFPVLGVNPSFQTGAYSLALPTLGDALANSSKERTRDGFYYYTPILGQLPIAAPLSFLSVPLEDTQWTESFINLNYYCEFSRLSQISELCPGVSTESLKWVLSPNWTNPSQTFL